MRAKAAIAARIGLLLVLAVAAWRVQNYRSDYEPGPDSSIFMSIAWHAENGRVLYTEELSGPPVIYALDAAALKLGDDGVNSVRAMERGFAVVAVAAIFVAVLLGFGRFWLAWVASALLLIHMYRLNVIEDGNVTEEFGAVFVLIGIACVIAASKSPGRKRLALGAVSGAAFSLAVLCKEPFLLIAPPWFLLAAWPRGGAWRGARNNAAAFLLGAVMPVIAFFGYLLAHGAWTAWVDSIAISFAYTANGPAPDGAPMLVRMVTRMSAKMEPMLVATVAAIIGLLAPVQWSWARKSDGLPLAIAGSAAMSLVAASLGGRFYGHYYLFFAPSFALLCASGIAFVADAASSNRRWSTAAIGAALVLLAFDAPSLKAFAGNFTLPAKPWKGHWLAELIRKNSSPSDPIWTPWKPLLYVETHRLAPTRWQSVFDAYFVDTPKSSAAQKFAALGAELRANPPRLIVISALPGSGPTRGPADEFLLRSGLTPWISANYRSVMCSPAGNTDVLLLKSATSTGPTPVTSDSVAMYVGVTSLYEQKDPVQAASCFRMVLARTPRHYGATFQLARALDANGQLAEATAQWRNVLREAREAKDQVTEAQALARLR